VVYDISPPLSPDTRVWPGDVPLTREVQCDLAAGASVTASAIRATVHLGSHADAPCHYLAGAPAIDACDLEAYLGPCQVLRVAVPRGGAVVPAMLGQPVTAPRILLATGTHPDAAIFNEDFAGLSVELVDHLHACGVRLVGVDTPSVDRFADQDLPVHRRIGRHEMLILEGLVLTDVPAGVYELIALPLRLVGFDGSPVRAVLRTLDGTPRQAPAIKTSR